jgi:hypothetical protein
MAKEWNFINSMKDETIESTILIAMKTKILFTLLCMFTFIPAKTQNTIEKLVVYKSFRRAGTTAAVSGMFKEPAKHSIDTANVNVGTDIFLNEFSVILNKSKRNKHLQQKIAGIEIAGEFWLNQSDKHFFIICFPDLLIDFTDKREYRITDKLLLKQMNDWINNLKDKK